MNNTPSNTPAGKIVHPPGFRNRRGLNWGFLGLLYTSFYMCRYNLSIANSAISKEFAFSRADMGTIITTALLAYAIGQIINGLLTDRWGGKRAMIIGATGTIIMNLLFGAAALWGTFSPAASHGPVTYEKGRSMEFVAEDVSNIKGFAKEMRKQTNALSVYLMSQYSDGTRQWLADTNSKASADSTAALVGDLNRILHAQPLYTNTFATNVAFSSGTTNLLAHTPAGETSVELNRLMLDEAYPQVIRKSHHWLVKVTLFNVEVFLGLLSFFVVIRGMDGYFQAFGAPGMIKINTAWFSRRERGRFAGIYGFMINLGRFGIFKIGPMLLAGFVFMGMWQVNPLHWRWLFWVPSVICGIVAIGMVFAVKETPEEAGFHNTDAAEKGGGANEPHAKISHVLKVILSNPTVWIVAFAYACTGAVRQGIDQWFPRFLEEQHHFDYKTDHFSFFGGNIPFNAFVFIGFCIPFVSSAGSLASGYISDVMFKGHRAPVAAALYFIETLVILTAAQFHTASWAIVFLILISFTANSTHSILGTAAAMDIGGRKMAGFASGVIDSFQYFGGSLAGYFLGQLLDKSWDWYFYFMAPFGFVGGLLMLFMQYRINRQHHHNAAKLPPSSE